LAEWPLANGLAFSESKIAAKMAAAQYQNKMAAAQYQSSSFLIILL
jgi:hypothetical protein